MFEDVTLIDRSLGLAQDFDLRPDGSWVGLFKRGDVLHVSDSYGHSFRLAQPVRFPLLRALHFDRVVGAQGVDVLDCYAACRLGRNRIAFSAYTGFELVFLEPRGAQHVQPLPKELHGASALSVLGEDAFLYGPYGDKTSLFAWRPGQSPRLLGKHSGPLRGLQGGRFLSNGEHGFTILDCSASAVS